MNLSVHEKEIVKPILLHPYTMGIVLYAIAIRMYGHEIHEWEPETLGLEFKDDLGVELPEINIDKIHALVAVVTSHGFYTDWTSFMLISQILNNDEDSGEGDPIIAAEMAWACQEAKLVDDKPHEWSHEVRRFVGKVLENEGFSTPPPSLPFALIPEKYHGSDTKSDENKQQYLTTEHAKVIDEYISDQSLLLFRQVSALPWHNENTIEELTKQLRS